MQAAVSEAHLLLGTNFRHISDLNNNNKIGHVMSEMVAKISSRIMDV